jgi:hypothetical protein
MISRFGILAIRRIKMNTFFNNYMTRNIIENRPVVIREYMFNDLRAVSDVKKLFNDILMISRFGILVVLRVIIVMVLIIREYICS